MITASIVTYQHSLSDIEPALKSLLDSVVDHVYIIDHSKDKHLLGDAIKGYSDKISYIEHANMGYGSGHNVALRIALQEGSEYHIVVNPDVWFDGKIIATIKSFMDANPEVGQLMPKVLYPDGSTQRLCKLLPTPFDIFGRLCLPRLILKRNRIYELDMANYTKKLNVPYLSGCFMFFRAETIRDVGLFDEHFFMYAEDIDMTRRVHERYVTQYYPDVNIYHKFSRASHRNLRLFYIHVTNLIMYFNKWGWIFDKRRSEINKATLAQFEDHN